MSTHREHLPRPTRAIAPCSDARGTPNLSNLGLTRLTPPPMFVARTDWGISAHWPRPHRRPATERLPFRAQIGQILPQFRDLSRQSLQLATEGVDPVLDRGQLAHGQLVADDRHAAPLRSYWRGRRPRPGARRCRAAPAETGACPSGRWPDCSADGRARRPGWRDRSCRGPFIVADENLAQCVVAGAKDTRQHGRGIAGPVERQDGRRDMGVDPGHHPFRDPCMQRGCPDRAEHHAGTLTVDVASNPNIAVPDATAKLGRAAPTALPPASGASPCSRSCAGPQEHPCSRSSHPARCRVPPARQGRPAHRRPVCRSPRRTLRPAEGRSPARYRHAVPPARIGN